MPIDGLQPRFAQVGVLRLGEEKTSPNRPGRKLETFRITSASRLLIERAAELYGGEVTPFRHQSGPQFQVTTDARELPVYVPPQVIDPNYEQWGRGYKARHCDGVTEAIRGVPCLCKEGPDHTHEFERDQCTGCPIKRTCKATTRMSVMLSDVCLGIWKLEGHGWNFASEMPMWTKAIATFPEPIPGRLELQVREKSVLVIVNGQEKIEPRRFVVPVLHFDDYKPREVFGALASGQRAAIGGGGTQRQAIGASAAADEPDWLALIGAAETVEDINNLMARMRSGGVKDPALVQAWQAKAEQLSTPPAPTAQPATGPARPAPNPVEDVVDAEVVEPGPEPDGKQVWAEILELAGQKRWNRPAVAQRFEKHMGFDYRDDKADGWALARFRDAVKAGEVQ